MTRRTERLNSLLREVLSEVIRKELGHENISELFTITRVDITRDLRYAKVYMSVIGDEKTKQDTLTELTEHATLIAVEARKKVRMRYFPQLTFLMDEGLEQHFRIEEALRDIEAERDSRDDSIAEGE